MQPAESMGTESDVQNAQEKILSIIASAGQACPLERVVFELVGVNPKNREVAVNGLLSSGRIEMVQGNTLGSISLRFRSGRQISGATAEEQLVFSLIEESGGKGMWIKDLREKTGLSPQALRKVLSSLERKKLVKSVKPVNSTKKCYILYSSDPDESLTGGVFYSDQQLDSAFVESLVHICVGFIKKKRAKAMEDRPSSSLLCYDESFVHPLELEEFIREKKVCRVSLNVANIERILSVAALDGLIERRSDGLYCIADSKDKQCAAACIPCMHCPVASDCKPGVAISPENCVHLTHCAPPPVQNWKGVGRGNAVSRQMDDAELSERNRYWNAGYKPTYNQFSYMQGYNRNFPRGNYNQRNARQQNVPRGHDRVPVRRDYSYCGDYDFEKANELFKEAIDNVVDDLAAANLDGSACKDNNVEEDVPKLIKDGKENIESVDKKDSKKFYDKSSSFFDRISCEALEPKDQKIRVDWRKEQETNQQTFGSTAVRSGNFRRGHSQYTNRGGRGMGGNRGGYNNYQVNMPQRFARGGMSFGSYNNLYSNGNRRRNNYTLQ